MEGRQLSDIYNTAVFIFCFVAIMDASASDVVEKCIESYYLSDGECYQCPDRCITCISDDRCTQCKHGYYGDACREACQECSGQCHQKLGHCTLGCPDGQFPDPNSISACLYCKQNCKLCSSLSHCVKCKEGFFGRTCNKICSELCTDGRCYENGECLNCGTGYYKSESACVKCPRGCQRCSGATKCSKCRDGFFGPYRGRCFAQCKSEVQTTYFVPHLDQGRCDSSTCNNICYRKGYCVNQTFPKNDGAVHFTNTNTCGEFLYQECAENCSVCVLGIRDGTVCNDKYICTAMCNLSNRRSTDGARICWHNISMDTLEEVTSLECVKAPSNTSNTGKSGLLIGTAVGVPTFLVVALIGCLFYRIRRNIKGNANDKLQEPGDERKEFDTTNQQDSGEVPSGNQDIVKKRVAEYELKSQHQKTSTRTKKQTPTSEIRNNQEASESEILLGENDSETAARNNNPADLQHNDYNRPSITENRTDVEVEAEINRKYCLNEPGIATRVTFENGNDVELGIAQRESTSKCDKETNAVSKLNFMITPQQNARDGLDDEVKSLFSVQ